MLHYVNKYYKIGSDVVTMCWDSLDMKIGWFLSMQIPSVPQRIDFKTYSGFTDAVFN